MKIKSSLWSVMLGAFVVSMLALATAFVPVSQKAYAAAAPDGKAVFLAQKCNNCHAIQTAGIEAKAQNEKLRGPDLGGVVEKLDPALVGKYVRKQEKIEGKLHKFEFKGTDDELKVLIDWLKVQKKAAA
ncbi:MAG: c-type cytochrome [Thermoanaerobaculia bacterium]